MIETSVDKTPLTPLWHHVAIMAAFAATFDILWEASTKHWSATIGLRLICLLLVSRKFWAAMTIGELLPNASMALPMLSHFGIEWVTVILMPCMLFCMPPVLLIQDRFPVFGKDGRVLTTRLLVVSLILAAIGTSRSSMSLFVMNRPDGLPGIPVTWQVIFTYFLGCYLGALTFAPGALAIRERLRGLDESLTWRGLMKRSLLRDVLLIELPILLAIQFLLHLATTNESVVLFQALMVIPLIVLSVKHGWHGTAVGGMIASIWLVAPTLGNPDPSLVPAQAVLAVAISAWLIWAGKRTPGPWIPAVAGASAWLAILPLIPMQSIRHAFSPRYSHPDGTRFDVEAR